jgi:putative ABC transport system permease protein
MIPISYNFRSLFVRKATTVATAFGVALVVFVLASSQMLSNGIERTMGRSGKPDHAIVLRLGADAELSSGIEQNLVSRVLSAPGVKKGSDGRPIGVGEVLVVVALDKPGGTGQISNVQLRGVPADVLRLRPEVKIVAGRPAQPGTDEVIVGRRIIGQYVGVDLNGQFTINKNRKGTVVGVFEAEGSSYESEIWADVETARTAFGREGSVQSITVALESPAKFEAFQHEIQHDKALGLQAQRELAYYAKASEGTAQFVSGLGGAVVFFFSIGAMIGAMITMYAAVQNRKREIGTLRAIGFSRATILGSFLLESLILTTVGGLLGTAALGERLRADRL